MQDAHSNTEPRGASKKKARKEIEKKLEAALKSLIPVLGEKKFRKRIKRAGKILSQDIRRVKTQGSFKHKKTKATVVESPGDL